MSYNDIKYQIKYISNRDNGCKNNSNKNGGSTTLILPNIFSEKININAYKTKK